MHINPRYIQARRRALRLEQPHLDYPTYVRRGLTPRVRIGCLRDPALPIELFPAIHTPPKKKLDLEYWATLGSCCVALFFIVSLISAGY